MNLYKASRPRVKLWPATISPASERYGPRRFIDRDIASPLGVEPEQGQGGFG